jgi:hypothetical protein
MLLQAPGSIIKEGNDSDVCGNFALATLCSPSSLKEVTTGEEFGPRSAEKVGNQDDESALDSN